MHYYTLTMHSATHSDDVTHQHRSHGKRSYGNGRNGDDGGRDDGGDGDGDGAADVAGDVRPADADEKPRAGAVLSVP
jgi:hypothetical protein